MKASTAAAFTLLAAASVSAAAEPQIRGTANLYNFDGDSAGKPPAGFTFARTKAIGRPGKCGGSQ